MSKTFRKLASLIHALCMLLSCMPAVAGTMSGDMEAKGHFYADYVTLDEALEAGNRLHIEMTQEGQALLKNENGALPLAADDAFYTVEGIRAHVPHFYEKTASVESQEGELSFGNFRKGENK
jgi:hypothetical protein